MRRRASFSSPRVRRWLSTAGCLPLADDLRRYTFTVYLLHVLPVGLLRGLLYPRLAVDPALFSALLFLSGVLIPWAVGRMARRWIPSSTAGGRLSFRLLGL